MATFYNAIIGITAALRARGITGKGQHVETSLLQGVLTTTLGGWQKVEKPDTPNFQTWVIDPRAPKGFFQCSDGRWTHHWVPLPSFVLSVSEGDTIEITEETTGPKQATLRVSTAPEDMVLLHTYNQILAERVIKFTADEWTETAAKVGVPVQKVRSPEEALADPLLVADGCVTEVDDPELGPLREVGRVVRLTSSEYKPQGPAPAAGQHTAEVLVEADDAKKAGPLQAGEAKGKLKHPLEGIRVLDLGLAVAGPYGTQVLGELGAEVIKVNTMYDSFWFSNHIAMCCNKDKRSIAINLKDAQGMELLRKLVATADVVQHNMRYDAAERLGVDYETLKQIKPDLIYCHTRGHEKGPRELHPGNDQTGAALAGTEWVEGGCDEGGKPIWPVISLGDTGNGMLSALGIVQALIHRDQTGEGQFLDTSILYAHLLNTSFAWATADGATVADRPKLDAIQQGWNALYRIYETSDEKWICVVALTDAHFAALANTLGNAALATDSRFATAEARTTNDKALIAALEPLFKARTAEDLFATLDGAGVPVEISNPDFVIDLFNDPEMKKRQWIGSYTHPVVGKMETYGLVWDFSDTPGKLWKGPLWPGQDTRAIMTELGYDDEDVEKLLTQGVVDDKSDMRST
jgi:crotonobetainyl-CoA:carnitine CoA-transferase CaiB-like acyl-CoA transferase